MGPSIVLVTTCTVYERRAIVAPMHSSAGQPRWLPRAFSSVVGCSGRGGRGISRRWRAGLELAQALLDCRSARTRLRGSGLEVHAVTIQRVRVCLEAVEVVLERGDSRVEPREITLQSCILGRRRPTLRPMHDDGGHDVRCTRGIRGLCGEGCGDDQSDAEHEGNGSQMTM